MTTTTTTQKTEQSTTAGNGGNRPSHEIFLVEGEGEAVKWIKVGVGFPTKSGSATRIYLGEKEDPKRRVYLVCPSSTFDGDDNERASDAHKRKPYADIFDARNNPVDFTKKDGVAFVNRDDSLTLLIGERGDPTQERYQMRVVRPRKSAA